MKDLAALLREAAGHICKHTHWDGDVVSERLFNAADALESSAEFALAEWASDDTWIECIVWTDDDGDWRVSLESPNRRVIGVRSTVSRADAIRAAIRAWEER